MDADTAYTISIVLFGVGVGTVVVNLILLGLMLKLYTEIFKARDQDRKKGRERMSEGRRDDGW